MAAQQSQGIQTLLEAEKEASRIVQQARQYRVQKLKDARTEATKEIEDYITAKGQEFRDFEASHAGTTSTTQVALDNDTDNRIREIEAVFKRKKRRCCKLSSRKSHACPSQTPPESQESERLIHSPLIEISV